MLMGLVDHYNSTVETAIQTCLPGSGVLPPLSGRLVCCRVCCPVSLVCCQTVFWERDATPLFGLLLTEYLTQGSQIMFSIPARPFCVHVFFPPGPPPNPPVQCWKGFWVMHATGSRRVNNTVPRLRRQLWIRGRGGGAPVGAQQAGCQSLLRANTPQAVGVTGRARAPPGKKSLRSKSNQGWARRALRNMPADVERGPLASHSLAAPSRRRGKSLPPALLYRFFSPATAHTG